VHATHNRYQELHMFWVGDINSSNQVF